MSAKVYRVSILVTGSAEKVRKITRARFLSCVEKGETLQVLRRLTNQEIRELRTMLKGQAYVMRFVPKKTINKRPGR